MTDFVEPEITVTRNKEAGRYEIHVGDVLGGFTEFADHGHGALFSRTEIDPAFEGRGLAKRLVSEALADIARRGETLVPECPFVVRYVNKNTVEGLNVDWARASDH